MPFTYVINIDTAALQWDEIINEKYWRRSNFNFRTCGLNFSDWQ